LAVVTDAKRDPLGANTSESSGVNELVPAFMPGIEGNEKYVQVTPPFVDCRSLYGDEGSRSSRLCGDVTTNCWVKQLLTDVTQVELVHLTPALVDPLEGPSRSGWVALLMLQSSSL
jgi:hypothetical protein